MRRRLVLAAVMLSGMLLPATVLGQGTPGAPRAPGAPGGMAVQVMAPDAAFVLRVADHDARRMAAARLAGTRALDVQVRAFAGRMVTDHTRTSAELMTFARARNIIVKSDPGVAQLVANTFAGMAGASFDVAYASLAVTDHEASVALFEEESRGGKDAELKAWASRTLPTLREHLRLARELRASVTAAPHP